ncbi:hypothetical protein ACWA2C_16980 [Priestia megaterium]
MPVYNTRDLIPFVNQLETKILEMNEGITEWEVNKLKLLNSITKADSTYVTAMSALVRADEALAEIGTASFTSSAARGKRLEDVLNKLKNDVYEIAANSSGGGGKLTDGIFYDELNNAIASVDATVEDGLKLDYRLQELKDLATTGGNLSDKELYMPYKKEMDVPSLTMALQPEEGVVYVEGDVTVLGANGQPFINEFGRIITGTITENGIVTLTDIPPEACTLYFPVQMRLKEVPQDFLYLFLEQIMQKNSKTMESILNFERSIEDILKEIEYMKGVNWTPDYSIMQNYQEVVKEGITPKGLNVEVKDGMANVTFSYNDHPHLSHFICEKWDESKKTFVPYDGVNGIIQK